MRKKWVIIAAVGFLGVVCGVISLTRKSHYPIDLVKVEIAKIAKHGRFWEFKPIMSGFGVSSSRRVYPAAIEKLIDWYDTFRDNRRMKKRVFFVHGSNFAHLNLTRITFHSKDDQIYEVEIKPELEVLRDETSLQYALDIQSSLAKAFPKLPCKIVTPP